MLIGVGIMVTKDTISPPNDGTLLKRLLRVEILQDERDYLLAAIEASPPNYFTNIPLHMSIRYLSQRIKEISEVVEQQQRDERVEEHIPQSDDEQIGADNPPDSLMPLQKQSEEV